jgi:hypothetical protein
MIVSMAYKAALCSDSAHSNLLFCPHQPCPRLMARFDNVFRHDVELVEQPQATGSRRELIGHDMRRLPPGGGIMRARPSVSCTSVKAALLAFSAVAQGAVLRVSALCDCSRVGL